MSGGYDNGYKACRCFWGKEPGSLVVRLQWHIPDFCGLEILDAGCGEGKNAIHLTLLGARVRAIDVSEHAFANARSTWGKDLFEACRWEVADIQDVELPASFYDVVLAYGLLHCLPNAKAVTKTIERLQKSTKNGGYNIIVAFNKRSQDLTAHAGFEPCLLDHSFYTSMYRGWIVIHASDSDLQEVHPHNHLRHTHSLTRILARKRGNVCSPTT